MSSDFVILTCPTCGSRLQVGNTLDQFACAHCGNEMIVRRSGGIIALEPVLASLDRIETGMRTIGTKVDALRPGVDSTASELAIQRLDKDLATLNHKLGGIKSTNLGCAWILVVVGLFGLASPEPAGAVVMLAIGALWIWFSSKRVKDERAPILEAIASAHAERSRHIEIVRRGNQFGSR